MNTRNTSIDAGCVTAPGMSAARFAALRSLPRCSTRRAQLALLQCPEEGSSGSS